MKPGRSAVARTALMWGMLAGLIGALKWGLPAAEDRDQSTEQALVHRHAEIAWHAAVDRPIKR